MNDAQKLIDDYFKAFVQIKKTLQNFGWYGVQNGFTQTLAPFNRKRIFPEWEGSKDKVRFFLQGIDKSPTLGRIERQSKNHPEYGVYKSGELRES